MDENTKFLIDRMDKLEQRLIRKIDELQEFKNKLLGMAALAGAFTSIVVNSLIKHIT